MAFLAPFALLAGAQAVGGAISGYLQYRAADKAGERARIAGDQAVGELRGSFDRSLADLNQGYTTGQNYLNQANQLYGPGLQSTRNFYTQQEAAGSTALQRLQSAILGGPGSGQQALAMDPGYDFRRQQGELGIQRAAAASGNIGSGSNLKSFARFNQDLASQEYGNALNRILGLVQIGQQGSQGLVGLAGAQAGILGQQSQLGVQQGQNLAQLRQGNAANIANALTGNAATQNQFDAAKTNAITNAIGTATNAATNAFGQYTFMNALSMPKTNTGITAPNNLWWNAPAQQLPYGPAMPGVRM